MMACMPISAYVFNRSLKAEIARLNYNGRYCRYEDDFILCSNVAGRSGLDATVLKDIATLNTTSVVAVSVARQDAGGADWDVRTMQQ